MKTLLAAIHSKFIHSGLALWYLKAACDSVDCEVEVAEYTVNDLSESVFESIYSRKPDCIGFSCYVWNIAYILRLASDIKKALPNVIIILGGPEVSFDLVKILDANPFIDIVMAGECEFTLKKVLHEIVSNGSGYDLSDIPGTAFRNVNGIKFDTGYQMVSDLDLLPTPYTDEMLSASQDKALIYIEASRGCPFSCSYCLSSAFEGVRCFSINRVMNDLRKIIKAGFKQIKFVDRTINCNADRFAEIAGRIRDLDTDAVFHFEAGGDLFNESHLDLLKTMPHGRIQLEIGIQSLNRKALESIGRKSDSDRLFSNIKQLMDNGNINVHLDLIAGLPFDTVSDFEKSFNMTYELKPHQLQLGFLKLLPGTKMRKHSEEHFYLYRDYAPYEVISNKYISVDDLIELKDISGLVNTYYNSGRFTGVLDSVIKGHFKTPIEFYKEFNACNHRNSIEFSRMSLQDAYKALLEYLMTFISLSEMSGVREAMILDFLSSNSSRTLPDVLKNETKHDFKTKCAAYIKNTLPLNSKMTHFELLSGSIHIFDYSKKDKVTGKYNQIIIADEDFI